MWVDKTKEEILEMEKNGNVLSISLFSTQEMAKQCYKDRNGTYMGYLDKTLKISTKFRVFMSK